MDIRLEKVEKEDIAEINRIQKLAFQKSFDQYKFCPAIYSALGSQDISQVETIYPDAVCWTLQTPEADDRNRYLYEKHGYEEEDRERINDHLTLIRYTKQLKENI